MLSAVFAVALLLVCCGSAVGLLCQAESAESAVSGCVCCVRRCPAECDNAYICAGVLQAWGRAADNDLIDKLKRGADAIFVLPFRPFGVCSVLQLVPSCLLAILLSLQLYKESCWLSHQALTKLCSSQLLWRRIQR